MTDSAALDVTTLTDILKNTADTEHVERTCVPRGRTGRANGSRHARASAKVRISQAGMYDLLPHKILLL